MPDGPAGKVRHNRLGKQNDVILDYFDDNERFADLYNGTLFNGRQAIDPEMLEDASEHYTQRSRSTGGEKIYRSRYRDVKKRLKDGGTLRILAVEAQEHEKSDGTGKRKKRIPVSGPGNYGGDRRYDK